VGRLLRIGTRRSALALWQARHISERLRTLHPGLEVSLVEMSTQGDRFLSAPLAAVGGKGLFVREIEEALLRGEVDLAVHSLKDLPADLPSQLILGPSPEREDPRDALVARGRLRLAELPKGARVGTSSLRRAVQLRAQRSDLQVLPVRGNVPTRLERTRSSGPEGLDAVVLAHAGLRRLGLAAEASELLPLDQFVPAVGQGVLGLERRADDLVVRDLLAPLDHPATTLAVRAERALLARLGAGCTVPLGAHAVLEGPGLRMTALVGDPDTGQIWRRTELGALDAPEQLGRSVAESLLAQGADGVLRRLGPGTSAPEV
jgi:hydroxymethylbilane synthase